jgi:hypothetical protein
MRETDSPAPSSVEVNSLTPELNTFSQRCPPIFLLEILIVKGLTARRLYKSFGVKGLMLGSIQPLLNTPTWPSAC